MQQGEGAHECVSLRPRNSATVPSFQPLASRRFSLARFMVFTFLFIYDLNLFFARCIAADGVERGTSAR